MDLRFTPEQIESWIARHFDYRKRKNGYEIVICNPFDGDTKYKFNINIVKGVCHDWRPGHQHWDGPFIKFVQKYKNITFNEAVRDVVGDEADARVILKSIRHKRTPVKRQESIHDIKLPDIAIPFRDRTKYNRITCIAANYLNSRGISIDVATKYDLHYSADRIFFPYYEYGILVYWQSRAIYSKKFEFPPLSEVGVGKEQFLYGFDFVEPGSVLYICESIIDAITLGDGAVASGGASMGKPQVNKIRALNPRMVVLSPDRDLEGLSSIKSNAELIQKFLDVDVMFAVPPAPYKDWNEMHKNNPRAWIEGNIMPVTIPNINKIMSTLKAAYRV